MKVKDMTIGKLYKSNTAVFLIRVHDLENEKYDLFTVLNIASCERLVCTGEETIE